MSCPACGVALVMSERQGVEIDYCPSCRGVWLDRGELDKIIERSARELAPPPPPAYRPDRDRDRDNYGQPRPGEHGHGGYPKRRKSFLEDLFD
jgi:uncharacterized protein